MQDPTTTPDIGTKECPTCKGEKKVIAYCYCVKPCATCDEFEYVDCLTCHGDGEVIKDFEGMMDDYDNALESRREANNE